MNKAKYEELFAALGRAPMKEFLELLFDGVPPELKKRLIIEDVSYHRRSAVFVTLDSWMVIDSPDSERWIWVRVEFDASHNTIEEQFLAKDSYRQQELHSLEECFDYYERKNAE
jgi:hypothetical protein